MSAFQPGNVLHRETLVAMLHAALQSGEFRFARQATLAWLAAFPGDLEVALLQAQSLIAERRAGLTVSALELACRMDPFSAQAYRLLAQVTQANDPQRCAFALTGLFVLDGRIPDQGKLEPWGMPLRQAYEAIEAGNYNEAGKYLHAALAYDPDLTLAAALHLLVDRATLDALTVHRLADIYHTRWPDCLPVNLVLAETYLELGNEPEAVRLLHLCAAGDTTGQVARRLWGENHPYRALWPEDPLILFDLPIPAGVAGRLGWNRLPQGEIHPVEVAVVPAEKPAEKPAETAAPAQNAEPAAAATTVQPMSDAPDLLVDDLPPDDLPPDDLEDDLVAEDLTPQPPSRSGKEEEEKNRKAPVPLEGTPPRRGGGVTKSRGGEVLQKSKSNRPRQEADRNATAQTIQAVSGEFEKLAKMLKQPELGHADGRQPVYVLFTSYEGLAAQYGLQTSAILNSELGKLAELVRQRQGWDAVVYYPDDAACTAAYGLTPVNPRDPWKLKNALADLDGALAKRGEMIGALLIVGGDGVVPFHRLPNPTDDADGEVPSDSPYGALGANYFVPDWPVGRLPGEAGADAGLLLEQLRHMQRFHARRKRAKVVLGLDWGAMIKTLFERILPAPRQPSFGYTAAAWRRSSLAVFRPIGAPHTVKASPPETSGSVDRWRITAANLGYYNLHGLADSPAWYGQRDPLEKVHTNGAEIVPDYPVALAPEDLHRNGHAPRVVFSEACYGGHIFGKNEGDSLALKFLSIGTLAVVGSTGIAYGSINTPLTAADLLGNLFWQHLKSGRAAGDALLQARIDMVREMNRRQGYLDGEDQKTLISFVLYGDPLATCESTRVHSKAVYRVKAHPLFKTVSDHVDAGPAPQLSSEALHQVKQIVAEYLPGADLGHLRLARQSAPMNGESAAPRLADRRKARPAENGSGRVVVTVSKQVQIADYVHHHYMRVTLDEGGKAVKFSISR